jgi:hypothetical protein
MSLRRWRWRTSFRPEKSAPHELIEGCQTRREEALTAELVLLSSMDPASCNQRLQKFFSRLKFA